MSKNFRDSESLGKSNEKKWSQMWTFLLKKCLKLQRKKKNFKDFFFLLLRYRLNGFFPNFLKLDVQIFRGSESLGENNEKKWSQMWTFLLKNGLKSPRRKKLFYRFFPLLTPFKCLFAPLYQSQLSRFYIIFFKSLRKTNRKKWSQIWILMPIKGVKLPRKKKRILTNVALLAGFFWQDFFGIDDTIRIGQEMLFLPYAGFLLLLTIVSVCWNFPLNN